ncbi:hypothetical protein Tco_1405424 [Tanacetum coccineum]
MSVRLADRSFQYPIGIAENMLVEVEEDFDASCDVGTQSYFHRGTPLEDKLCVEFDEFMAINIKESSESDFDKEEIPFEKITFDTDYKIKKSLD